jgi:acetylornithine deacetylase/succinyl-diaminopimelate desuccinylase-like protein
VELEFSGTPAHGSLYPAVGVSAIMEAMELLEYVKDLHDREYPVDEHLKEIMSRSAAVLGEEFRIKDVSNVLKKLTFNPGIITGGEKSNVVAQHCTLELELRDVLFPHSFPAFHPMPGTGGLSCRKPTIPPLRTRHIPWSLLPVTR